MTSPAALLAAQRSSVQHEGHPFQFVDAILEMEERKLVAVKNVSLNEVYFTGHFPGQPVMPGVLITESLVQAARLLLARATGRADEAPALAGIERIRFRRPVIPGDLLTLHVELLEWDESTAKFKGEARVADQAAAGGNFTLAAPGPPKKNPQEKKA